MQAQTLLSLPLHSIEMRNMRFLVTGGAGFLGSHLCTKLISQGHEVLCVDNYFTGSKKNISFLLGNPNFEVMRHDVTTPLYVDGIDGIFNLACPASPIQYQKHPVETLKTSVHGAINMLGLAKRTGAKILQASTSEVYGDAQITPQSEEYWGNVNPIGIRSCYDEGKRAAESLFFDYMREYSVEIRVARIFNTYGPKMGFNDGRVVSNFIVQALNNQPITLYGDGSQTRSFCYVDDLIEGLISLYFKEGFTGPVNLGNPEQISMNDLAQEIIDLTESSSRVEFRELPKDDPKNRVPNITLASSQLGWAPKTNRAQGLVLTINDFKERMSATAPEVRQTNDGA
jgi:UDP-glucuronate decarboxylase